MTSAKFLEIGIIIDLAILIALCVDVYISYQNSILLMERR